MTMQTNPTDYCVQLRDLMPKLGYADHRDLRRRFKTFTTSLKSAARQNAEPYKPDTYIDGTTGKRVSTFVMTHQCAIAFAMFISPDVGFAMLNAKQVPQAPDNFALLDAVSLSFDYRDVMDTLPGRNEKSVKRSINTQLKRLLKARPELSSQIVWMQEPELKPGVVLTSRWVFTEAVLATAFNFVGADVAERSAFNVPHAESIASALAQRTDDDSGYKDLAPPQVCLRLVSSAK